MRVIFIIGVLDKGSKVYPIGTYIFSTPRTTVLISAGLDVSNT
jgi:hypothetical protein